MLTEEHKVTIRPTATLTQTPEALIYKEGVIEGVAIRYNSVDPYGIVVSPEAFGDWQEGIRKAESVRVVPRLSIGDHNEYSE